MSLDAAGVLLLLVSCSSVGGNVSSLIVGRMNKFAEPCVKYLLYRRFSVQRFRFVSLGGV